MLKSWIWIFSGGEENHPFWLPGNILTTSSSQPEAHGHTVAPLLKPQQGPAAQGPPAESTALRGARVGVWFPRASQVNGPRPGGWNSNPGRAETWLVGLGQTLLSVAIALSLLCPGATRPAKTGRQAEPSLPPLPGAKLNLARPAISASYCQVTNYPTTSQPKATNVHYITWLLQVRMQEWLDGAGSGSRGSCSPGTGPGCGR